MDIKNKAVLITGGAVRIGRAISLKMSRIGARVFCHFNKSVKEAHSLKDECKKKGLEIHLLQADLTKKESAEVLIQNIIDTAGTIVEAVKVLKENGAEEVHIACTHPIFSGKAIERLRNLMISKITVTDTLPLSSDKIFENINILSVANLFGEAIKRIHNEESISSLFN